MVSRLEVVETGRRRRWSEAEKLWIVAESLRGRRLVSATARRHGISRSLLTSWAAAQAKTEVRAFTRRRPTKKPFPEHPARANGWRSRRRRPAAAAARAGS